MFKNKPLTIKVIIGLFILKLAIIAFIILSFAFVKDIDPNASSVAAAIRNGLVHRFNLDMSNTGYAMGTLIGANLIPMLVSLFGIRFIIDRKKTPTLVILIIDVIIGLGMMNPFIAIINLILFYQKKSQEYLKGIVISDELIL